MIFNLGQHRFHLHPRHFRPLTPPQHFVCHVDKAVSKFEQGETTLTLLGELASKRTKLFNEELALSRRSSSDSLEKFCSLQKK